MKGKNMKVELNSLLQTGRSGLVKAGDIAKAKRAEIAYNRAMASLFEHTDHDYEWLTSKMNKTKSVPVSKAKTFAEGIKSFFERGCMF